MQEVLVDANQRKQALDVTRSFLVQAPAGSGKTGLLIQRFLALLLTVERHPEECLAITFTRKAASEMRERLVDALIAAKSPEPAESYRRKTWQLARKVLQKDESLQWNLIENPQRLKILTFDAFCASLTRRMPVMANFGFQPNIRENSQELYDMAVIRLLQQPERMAEIAQSYEVVLKHLDNNKLLLKKLLIELLGQREQWLSPVLLTQQSDLSQAQLEAALAAVVEHYLQRAADVDGHFELVELANFAAQQVEDTQSPIRACLDRSDWPMGSIEDLDYWKGLAELCLTSKNEPRKKMTAKVGFPPATKAETKEEKTLFKMQKQRMEALLEELADLPELVAALTRIKMLPPLSYQPQQWKVLSGLAQILLYAVAELALVFQETGEVDFGEISIAASRSLGAMDAPSDLALALDYRIRHVLVDEFQDTSIAQFELLKLLISGWEIGDGRSLFLVGDPMQSIYRFRQAEVGLFLAVKHQGVGTLPIEFIQLQANFRSEPPIVNWVNQTFAKAFPATEDLSLGAIPYSISKPVKTEHAAGVRVAVCEAGDGHWQAQQVVKAIRDAKKRNPNGSIAILVRSRNHLLDIIPELKAAKIQYQGVDIDLLANKPEVQDLLALTRAMTHLADRTAWLALLRAPWCGLSMAQLTEICDAAKEMPLWHVLEGFQLKDDEAATLRLHNVVAVIKHFMQLRASYDFATWLHQLWLGLDGPQCYASLEVNANAQVYFHLLSDLGESHIYQTGVLEEKLAAKFTWTETTETGAVQIMTMHKAKGLEFDTVILPGLGRKPQIEPHRLFLWQEWTEDASQHHLLMAPIQPLIEKAEPIYQFLRQIEKEKQQHEALRLLYVASTRAKQELILLGEVPEDRPAKNSLLSYIWPAIEQEVAIEPPPTAHEETADRQPVVYQRLTDAAVVAKVQNINFWQQEEKAASVEAIHLAQLKMRAIGTTVHHMLWRIVENNISFETIHSHLADFQRLWREKLMSLAVSGEHLEESLDIVTEAILKTIADEKGRWILQSREQSFAEYPMMVKQKDSYQKLIIDRMFIEDDICWIVDYKTCLHQEIEEVMSQHQGQLIGYKRAMQLLYPELEIKTAFYFPLQQIWQAENI